MRKEFNSVVAFLTGNWFLLILMLPSGCADISSLTYVNRSESLSDPPPLKTPAKMTFAVGARYYECHFHSQTENEERADTIRFVVNSHMTSAFRNDHGPGHSIRLTMDPLGTMVFFDYIPSVEVFLLTVAKDGKAVLSRHALSSAPLVNYKKNQYVQQANGACFQLWDLARNFSSVK